MAAPSTSPQAASSPQVAVGDAAMEESGHAGRNGRGPTLPAAAPRGEAGARGAEQLALSGGSPEEREATLREGGNPEERDATLREGGNPEGPEPAAVADHETTPFLDAQPAEDRTDTGLRVYERILVFISFFFTVITFPISIWMCIKIIKEYERAIVFRLGRIRKGGAKGPGLVFILPCTDSFIKVDMRTISFDIPPQEILTKDSVTVNVDGVVYYQVQNAIDAVKNISNADSATRLLAQTTLRNVLGTKNLSQILSDRKEIAHGMQDMLADATKPWGVKVERVEIKDVKLPVQLQRAMAAEAEATREARAKVIAAEGEMNASRALKEASIVFTESPAALQLRYLQTLTTIAAENSTIVFPLPINMLQGIMGANR
ncbi:stomatin [Gavia stellata]|nr:stomatin [Gavia stellata]